MFCVVYFGCLFGDCKNQLICFIHYIKFFQCIYLVNTYYGNIQESQPNHPIGTLNAFIVILMYYLSLYRYIDQLNEKEPPTLVHFCALYPGCDFIVILISFIAIRNVKEKSNDLITRKEFREYAEDAQIALADILYLPQEFDSDEGDNEY